MGIEVEKLNDLYSQELIKFVSKMDFLSMNETKIQIIRLVQEYFKNNFKGLLAYDESELEEKIVENFQYGVDRSKQTIDNIRFFHFENLDEFDVKDCNNKEERNNVINSMNPNSPANNFSDLDERIAVAIDGYLSKRNWDNKNYERYYYAIKTFIRNSVKQEKNKMLIDLTEQLTKQSQLLEKKLLEEYKSILVSIDQRVMPNIVNDDKNNDINNLLMPVLDLPQNEIINTDYNECQSNESLELPGDILK